MIVGVKVGYKRNGDTERSRLAVDFRGVRATGEESVTGEGDPLSNVPCAIGNEPALLRFPTRFPLRHLAGTGLRIHNYLSTMGARLKVKAQAR